MSSHQRVLLFCASLLVAPLFWFLGDFVAGETGGMLLPIAVVVAVGLYAQGGKPKPPASAPQT